MSINSPFLGLIFILSFSDRYCVENRVKLDFISFALILLLLIVTGMIDTLILTDAIFGAVAPAVVFLICLKRDKNYFHSILYMFGMIGLYSVFRFAVFGDIFAVRLAEASEQLVEMLSSENQDLVKDYLSTYKTLVEHYYIGIWSFSISLAGYIGVLLRSRRVKSKWRHKEIRIQFFWVYILMLGLGLFLMPQTRIIAVNLLMVIAPIFVISGFSIIDFYLGEHLKRSRLLLIVFVSAIVLILPYLGLIMLIGLTDVWFNYRKIYKEGNDENHPN